MGKPVSPHGFVSYAADGSPTYLPLKSVSAKVYIVDVSARVILTQLYSNSNSIAANECASAQYIFPVPANGAVCAFTMQTADGRIVRGVVKERVQAEKEYEFAIAHNTFAGLVYEATPDIFVITMGAIPRGQDVQVTIMYITPLTDSDLPGYDQIEFTLPTYIGTRYGPPPASLPSVHPAFQRLTSRSSRSDTARTMLDIVVHVQMPSEILEVSSCTHTIKVDMHTDADKDADLGSSPYSATVALDPAGPPPKLNRDFVLAIRAAQLSVPRCVADVVKFHHLKDKSSITNSVALSLTFVPRLKLRAPALSSLSSPSTAALENQQQRQHEYIFLIDRSGSMANQRIEHAKEALMLFVKSLPSGKGTSFNVFGFGSTCVSLWSGSRGYDQGSVAVALDHINTIDADLGGTEIEHTLRCVLRTRNAAVPTSIFVLTDGEVYDVDPILSLVSASVSASHSTTHSTSSSSSPAPVQAPLRFFTLGIGDSASTALCEGVARVGGGVCLMSRREGDVAGKCGRLLNAASAAALGVDAFIGAGAAVGGIGGIGIGIGIGGVGGGSVGGGDVGGIGADAGGVEIDWGYPSGAAKVLQAPTRVPALYPENRLTVYAIVHDTDVVPEEVVLYQRGKGRRQRETMRVPVCLVEDPLRVGGDRGVGRGLGWKTHMQTQHATQIPPLIHTMAAQRIIQELEDGNLDAMQAVRGVSVHAHATKTARDGERERREEIVRLSERFQIASRWASFVAVEGEGNGDGDGDGDKRKEEERKNMERKNVERKNVKGNNDDDDDDDDGNDDEDDFYLDEEEEKARASARRAVRIAGTSAVANNVDANGDTNTNANAGNDANTAGVALPSSISGLYPKTDRPSALNLVSSGSGSGWPGVEPTPTHTSAHPRTHSHLLNVHTITSNTAPSSSSAPFHSIPIPNANAVSAAPSPISPDVSASARGGWGSSAGGEGVRPVGVPSKSHSQSQSQSLWPGVGVDSEPAKNGVSVSAPRNSDSSQANANANATAPLRTRGVSTATTGGRSGGVDLSLKAGGVPPQSFGLRRSHTRIASVSASASVVPPLAPLVTSTKMTLGVSTSAAVRGPTQTSSYFVNAFKAPGPSANTNGPASGLAAAAIAKPTKDGPIAVQRSAGTGTLRTRQSMYFLETVSTVDAGDAGLLSKVDVDVSSIRTSVGHRAVLAVDQRVNDTLPSANLTPGTGSNSKAAQAQESVGHSEDAGCHARMRMPGAYPHGCCPCCCCCCCCRRVVDHHRHHHHHLERQSAPTPTPSPAPEPHLKTQRSRTTLARGGRERPQSVLYELETAVCLASFFEPISGTAVLGTVDEEDEDKDEDGEPVVSQPMFTPSAASKTGVYRAPRKPIPAATGVDADAEWTTRAPIIDAANMQRFDGSFVLDASLHALVVDDRRKKMTLERLRGAIPARLKEHCGGGDDEGEVEKIWATVLVAAYLKKVLPEDREVWIGLWDKAAGYVEGKVGKREGNGEETGMSFAGLVLAASRLV